MAMIKNLITFLALLLLMLAPLSASAASGPWQGNDVMKARLVSATTAVGDASSIEAGLEFKLKPGWKVYWRSPGDAGLPPVLDFSASGDVTDHHLDFPAPTRFSILGFDSFGYGEGVVLPLRIDRLSPGRALTVVANLDGLVCKDICIPVQETLTLSMPRGEAVVSEHARDIAKARARVPGQGTAAGQMISAIAVEGSVIRLGLARGGVALPLDNGDVLIEARAGFSFSKPRFRGDR